MQSRSLKSRSHGSGAVAFSTKGEYGVRLMVQLGRRYGTGPASLAERPELATVQRTLHDDVAAYVGQVQVLAVGLLEVEEFGDNSHLRTGIDGILVGELDNLCDGIIDLRLRALQ